MTPRQGVGMGGQGSSSGYTRARRQSGSSATVGESIGQSSTSAATTRNESSSRTSAETWNGSGIGGTDVSVYDLRYQRLTGYQGDGRRWYGETTPSHEIEGTPVKGQVYVAANGYNTNVSIYRAEGVSGVERGTTWATNRYDQPYQTTYEQPTQRFTEVWNSREGLVNRQSDIIEFGGGWGSFRVVEGEKGRQLQRRFGR